MQLWETLFILTVCCICWMNGGRWKCLTSRRSNAPAPASGEGVVPLLYGAHHEPPEFLATKYCAAAGSYAVKRDADFLCGQPGPVL
ncbi:MAG: hypothetical protein QOI30_680 [Mycobacterium sp.]|jgi:hypothetical protein|nr:hypothetical protein [Mycobacterium sp.]